MGQRTIDFNLELPDEVSADGWAEAHNVDMSQTSWGLGGGLFKQYEFSTVPSIGTTVTIDLRGATLEAKVSKIHYFLNEKKSGPIWVTLKLENVRKVNNWPAVLKRLLETGWS